MVPFAHYSISSTIYLFPFFLVKKIPQVPVFFFLTILCNWNKIFIGYRRDSLIIRGAEGANPEKIGTKLSGKRTVT